MTTRQHWILAGVAAGLALTTTWVATGQMRHSKPRIGLPNERPPAGAIPPTVAFAGGTFQMGSNDGPASAKPEHTVQVAPFAIQTHEATVAEYKRCVDAGRCSPPNASGTCNWGRADRDSHPVNCVDYSQAERYCAFLRMRLPTEQEWEYAARNPDGRLFPWGNSAPTDQACWKRSEGTCVAGSLTAGRSAEGLDDMAGNVAEWTASPFVPYAGEEFVTTERAVRGGGWSLAVADGIRTTARIGSLPGVRSATIGFRCARSGTTP